jgi:hypothetical protein
MIDQYKDILPNLRNWIKERLKKTITKSQLTYDYLGLRMGISATRLFNQTDTNNQKDRFHLENLLILIKETGDFAILDEIEALFGRVAYERPNQTKPSQLDAVQSANQVLQEVTDFVHVSTIAIQDGKINGDEWARIRKEFIEAQQQMCILEEKLALMCQGAPKMKVVGES